MAQKCIVLFCFVFMSCYQLAANSSPISLEDVFMNSALWPWQVTYKPECTKGSSGISETRGVLLRMERQPSGDFSCVIDFGRGGVVSVDPYCTDLLERAVSISLEGTTKLNSNLVKLIGNNQFSTEFDEMMTVPISLIEENYSLFLVISVGADSYTDRELLRIVSSFDDALFENRICPIFFGSYLPIKSREYFNFLKTNQIRCHMFLPRMAPFYSKILFHDRGNQRILARLFDPNGRLLLDFSGSDLEDFITQVLQVGSNGANSYE